MGEIFDAVVTAGGRLEAADAARFGTDVKALVKIGGRPLLAIAVEALRGVRDVARISVVGPRAASSVEPHPDNWIDEFPTGEENLLAALGSARTRRVVFCASDLPFVTASAISRFMSMVRESICAAYPVFERGEFLAAYPRGRSRFLKLAGGEWTGGSVMVLEPSVLRLRSNLIRQVFAARKEPMAMSKLLGLPLTLRYMAGRARLEDLELRASQLLGKPVAVIRDADPSLGMDCDDADDFDYALAYAQAGMSSRHGA